jgi:hypothetical protein
VLYFIYLRSWMMIYEDRDRDVAKQMSQAIVDAARRDGANFANPHLVQKQIYRINF